jgi:hypothetical protein
MSFCKLVEKYLSFFSSIGRLAVKNALCGLWEKREGVDIFYTLNPEAIYSPGLYGVQWPFLVFDETPQWLLQPYGS